MMYPVLISAATMSAPVLDRVELLADDPGTFLMDEVPLLRARPGGTALRALAQVQPVVRMGGHFTLGVSMSTITPAFEIANADTGVGAVLALPTRLGLPTGALLAASWRRGPLWVDVGMRATSGATWLVPGYGDLRVGPTVGLGWVPKRNRTDNPTPAPNGVPAPDRAGPS